MHFRSKRAIHREPFTPPNDLSKGASVNRTRISTLVIAALVVVLAACGGPTPAPDQAKLTVATTGQGTVEVDGKAYTKELSFATGKKVKLEAKAAAGWTFTGWGGACGSATGATCEVTMNGDKNVTATFAQATTYTITVATDGTGSGTVQSDGADVTEVTVEAGGSVELVAVAAADSAFTGWSGACDGQGATCTLTDVQADASTTATFDLSGPTNTVTLDLKGTGTGTVTVNGTDYDADAVITVASGSDVTLNAAAGTMSRFDGWDGACGGETTNTCTLPALAQDVQVGATFNSTQSTRVEKRIGTTADGRFGNDGEQFLQASNAGAPFNQQYVVSTSTAELELTYSSKWNTDQAVGLRFTDLNIPAGATITRAFIEFTAHTKPGDGTVVNLTLSGEKAVDPAQFPDGQVMPAFFGNRPKTDATVPWKITDAWAANQVYASADITPIVQEIIDLGGWTSGQSDLAIYLVNDESDPDDAAATAAKTGVRVAWDSKGDPDKAAKLVIEYEMN